jgi:hypothetical protein
MAPRLKKGYDQNWKANLQTLGTNVPAFISNLGPNTTSQKCLKLAPSFSALTSSVKRALISWGVFQVQIIFRNELL